MHASYFSLAGGGGGGGGGKALDKALKREERKPLESYIKYVF